MYLGHEGTITYESWPEYNESKLTEEVEVEVVVQVNGKVRGKVFVKSDMSDEDVKKSAKEIDNVKRYLEGHEIIKEIVVPKKLVSFVIK